MKHVAVWLAFTVLAAGQDPLEVTGGLEQMLPRYLTGIARKQWEARAAEVARLRTPAEVKARQSYIYAKVMEQIGGFPERTPLNPRITGTIDRDGYRVEKLIFESQPHYYVTANVFVPTGAQPPFPAVLGVAGHSVEGKANPTYQRGWIGLAKRGFLVLAYDPPGQGERLEYYDAEQKRSVVGVGTREHTTAGTQCLLTGANFARWEAWDGVRAFDYLITRKDVDPKRIAVAGNSGGGTQSAYLAVMEPRLAAAAPSCYITSWEKLWAGSGPQDAEQVFAGFLRDGLDFSDFLIAFAPKPILMLTAIQDFFPIDGARATYAEARRVFGLLKQDDRAGYFEYDDKHGWSTPRREATYRWFARWLQGRQDDGREPAFDTMDPEQLNATETGQVSTSLKGETVQSLNAALAERVYAKRTVLRNRNVAGLVAARLGVSGPRGLPAWQTRGEPVARQGYRIEKIEMQPEPEIIVPLLVFIPEGGEPHKPGVLYLNPAGKAADLAGIEALVKAGNVVLSADLRNWGESAPPRSAREGYTNAYQNAQRALLVGKTLVGMQVYDALRAFDLMAARHEVDAQRIAVTGKDNGAVVALYTAVLEPRIAAARIDAPPQSYLDIARTKVYRDGMDLIVPGVLRDFDLPDLVKGIGRRAVVLNRLNP